MLLDGVEDKEVTQNWLTSIECGDLLSNFVDNGYDIHTITRMTPQDLTAIGCKSPITRKKLLLEIKKLNIQDYIPEIKPDSLEKWLHILKLIDYYPRLCAEGYDTIDKVCDLTWEDLEEIGITKLGHQKRLLLGIDKLKKSAKQQEEQQNHQDNSIYDVHPNYRVSLNKNSSSEARLSTLSRSTSRSGFFQTRSGANLDHRGLPVATVKPALKHINSIMTNSEFKPTDNSNSIALGDLNQKSNSINNNDNILNNRFSTNSIYGTNTQQRHKALENPRSMNDFCTLKRVPPPLPPMRTNSLKYPSNGMLNHNNNDNNNNSIYGNTGGTFTSNQINSSTSFVRTPKIGALTATTNKMLTLGGHIRSIDASQSTLRAILPIREAPTPPNCQTSNVPRLQEKIDEESCLQMHSFVSPITMINSQTLMNTSSISHQLPGPDEFPPPPPSE